MRISDWSSDVCSSDLIVTLGAGDLDPAHQAGMHLDPADWNALIADPDTVLIDTRNAYEVAVGSFEGALDPGTRSFRDFPAWFDDFAGKLREEGRKPRIAMFCTGGIRCENSTAMVRARGIEERKRAAKGKRGEG